MSGLIPEVFYDRNSCQYGLIRRNAGITSWGDLSVCRRVNIPYLMSVIQGGIFSTLVLQGRCCKIEHIKVRIKFECEQF